MMKQRSKRGTRGAGQVTRRKGNALSHPPQIDGVELRHSVRMRFVASSAQAISLTFQNLLDTYLVATSAVTASQVFQTVKIREVEVWAVPALGGASTVIVEFAGITAGIVGDQAYHTDTSMGISPAHVIARPSRRSLASEYQLPSAAIAFNLTCPTGSVVDVMLSFRGQFAVTAAATNATVGATAGAFYLRGLDGLAAAGTQLPAQGGVAI